ncbi:MAG: hypothetical protein OER97_00500 [Gammaproteobacteria bacterium]|nr:hypothetical protein [Gammaproteobacteria bacterium]
MKNFRGQCHCGAIAFDYSTALPPGDWPIRACQCAFCRAHDALSTSDTAGTLIFTATVPDYLQRYRFAMKTADFLLCRNCGVYIGAVIDTANGCFGIINTHALETTPVDIAAVAAMNYDQEDKSGRVSRREDRWTPVQQSPDKD